MPKLWKFITLALSTVGAFACRVSIPAQRQRATCQIENNVHWFCSNLHIRGWLPWSSRPTTVENASRLSTTYFIYLRNWQTPIYFLSLCSIRFLILFIVYGISTGLADSEFLNLLYYNTGEVYRFVHMSGFPQLPELLNRLDATLVSSFLKKYGPSKS